MFGVAFSYWRVHVKCNHFQTAAGQPSAKKVRTIHFFVAHVMNTRMGYFVMCSFATQSILDKI